jgi:uncharacterized protein YqhQ
MARFNYGGQALIEGVLMRGRNAIAVAVRHPDGDIVWEAERLDESAVHRHRAAGWPFVRGLVVLYETLVIGTRWLMRSAAISASGAGVELGRGTLALTLTISLAFGIGLFFLLPLVLAQLASRAGTGSSGTLAQHLLEAAFRLGIFVGYLLLISRSSEIRRVFQYHGAEHMSIHALEAGDPLTPGAVRRYPTAHQRCGTEFLLVVVVVSILAFSLLAGQSLAVAIVGRIALIPVIVAVSYEVLRWGARHRAHPLVHVIFLPGIWLQLITTRQPDDSMIEVAIVSLQEAMRADGEAIPAGSVEPARRTMAEAEAAMRLRAADAGGSQVGPPAADVPEAGPAAPDHDDGGTPGGAPALERERAPVDVPVPRAVRHAAAAGEGEAGT